MQDPISDLLDSVRLDSAICGRIELTAPWGFRYGPSPDAPFYFVETGTAFIEVAQAAPLRLAAGDYVVLPHGSAYVLRDSLSTAAVPLVLPDHPGPARDTIRAGGGGAATTVVGGHLRLDRKRAKALLRILPDILHVAGADGQPADELRPLAAAGAREASRPGPGSAVALARLSEMFFLQAVRAEIARHGDGTTCRNLAGAPKVAAALRLIQADPAAHWSLAELAAQVGMSRSTFAAAFASALGEPPMQYLAGLRMARAAELLRTPGLTIAEVAFQVGYESDVAFARVFKRHYGVAPGVYRQPRPVAPATA